MPSLFNSLPKSSVILDIGADEIKAVSAGMKNDMISLSIAEVGHTPINTIKDGEIIDAEKLGGFLRYFLNDKFPGSKFVTITIQPTSAMTRELVLPVVPEKEIPGLIHYEIENRFSVDLNNYAMEYTIVDNFVADDGSQKMRVFVVILPTEIVETYYNLIKSINHVPLALDINANAIAKIFKKPLTVNDKIKYKAEETVAILDLGKSSVNMTIVGAGKLRLSRLFSLPDFEIDFGDPDAPWINEVYRVIQYYESMSTESNISQIFLHGGKSQMSGIDRYITEALGIPAAVIESLDNISISILARDVKLGQFYNALGASIRN